MKTPAAVFVLFASLTLGVVGCGGGGYASSAAAQTLKSAGAPQQPFNIASKTLTAMSMGNTYTATYSETPNSGTTTFNGQMASSSNITLTVLQNGTTISTENSIAYYLTNPYSPLGVTGTSNGTAFEVIFNSIAPLPTMLTVGASGPVASGSYYTPGTNTVIGSFAETYSVVANDSVTLLLNVVVNGMVNGAQIAETVSYTVDASGNIVLLSVQVTVNGATLTFM